MESYRMTKAVSYSLLGGFVGALVMGAIAYMMPIPNTGGAPFFVAVAMLMGMGAMWYAAGWILHLITGILVGAIFGVIVVKVSSLRLKGVGRALGLGAAAGLVVWVVFFMPMMAMFMPALTGMGAMVGGSFAAHIIFGLILGGVASLAIPKGNSFECPACGATFSSESELGDHGKTHMTSRPAQRLKCPACGASFTTEQELMEHKGKAHPM